MSDLLAGMSRRRLLSSSAAATLVAVALHARLIRAPSTARAALTGSVPRTQPTYGHIVGLL